MIDISGLDKKSVLKALYASAKPLGMGIMHFKAGDLPDDEADALIGAEPGYLYFDYLNGRLMKVDITGDSFSPDLYDRDNGHGAAAAAIDSIR